ncbi:MAG: hypothetical protein JW814_08605 [Candidatus Krumholzibacteriota bacterium]|nr:hypothetical protein [Candidatus Krumholzibacteriota bacterium]
MKRLTSSLAALAGGVLLTITGALSAWIVNTIHYSRYQIFAADFRCILAGEPYSPAFANRRLGPWTFTMLDRIFGSSEVTLSLIVYAACVALPWLGYLLGRRLGWSIKQSLGAAVVLCVSFVLLQDDYWLMIWDLYDVLFFTWFAYAIFRRLSISQMVPVFLIMIFNRETALFVPLWFLIRGFLDRDRRTMLTAGLMGIAGVIVTLAWRLPYMGRTGLPHVGGNHFRPTANWRILLGGNNEAWLALALSITVIILTWRTIRVTVRGRENEFRGVIEAMSVTAALALVIPVVGYIGELRLYLPVAPLIIFSFVSLRKGQSLIT